MTTTKVRAGIVAAVAAVGLFGAGTASAADTTLTWKGAFPIIGEQTVETVVHVDIPEQATPGEQLSVPFSIDVDAGTAAADGLRLVGATQISGEISSSVTITASDGQSVPLTIKLPIPETPVPAEGSLTFAAEGSVDFAIPEGVPSGPAETTVDPEASTHVVTDSSLGEFDVELALDPPDQDTLLGTTEVG
ncbi:DUF6801 domain-containing protein [Amycolatopsis aidingensis]|uniref:DUF6801 domain-containing protein n=1 Tax=Amycolatopsis aidingensis TaxID=2842453 RepID=UPI001C0B8DF5|nr:DUF6801 domain-containing protein [Amycolatopsis aidingensis]